MVDETKAHDSEWQRQMIEKLALSSLKEQKAARRWGIFFKILIFVYLFTVMAYGLGWVVKDGKAAIGDHTALIDVAGIIQPGGEVTASNVINSLENAYEDEGTKGIILRINSPGGSPVQAGMIYEEIKRQKELHPDIPVYAVVEDICASGGYYIAAAADEIYVDKASIVGSIGVLMNGYGFTGTMEKLGIERRLLTAGKNKAMLDPFSPVNPEHQAYAQSMLNEIHEQFKSIVREGRGDRLKENEDVFSGLFWSGEKSIKLGLADALGSTDFVAREVIQHEKLVDFSYKENFADRFAKRLGASIAKHLGLDVSMDAPRLR